MGRDVTGIRHDMKPTGMNFDRVHVAPTIASDNSEPEQGFSTTDRNFKGEVREDVQENQEVLTAKSTNIESGVSSGIRAKISALQPKLSVKASPSLKLSPTMKESQDAEALERIKLGTPRAEASQEDSDTSESMKISTPKARSSQEASESIITSTPRAQISEEEVSDDSESIKISTPKAHSSKKVSTDKIASEINNASEGETNSSTNSPRSKKNDLRSPVATQTTQSQFPSMSGKSTQSDSEDKHHDEEDNYSVSSSGSTSTRSRTKFKPTVPVGPKFVCDERITKRREYYKKLEERQKALEAQKLAEQARFKEEEEAALQKLRRSMSYKANPVPSFYREGPPPKPKLKKVPLTRPKSPNLTRTKSFNDAPKSASDEKKSATATNKKDRSGTKTGSKKVTTNTYTSEAEQIDSDKCVVEGKHTSQSS